MLIYKAISPTGKCYIGQTSLSFELRKKCHYNAFISAKNHKRFNVVFYNAIMKHGWDKFKWKILENNIKNQNVLNKREEFYIEKYNSLTPNGYNMTIGSVGCKGYKHTKKHRERMRKLFKGRKISEEWRKKIQIAKQEHPSFLGKKHTKEWKEKMRKINLGKKMSKKSRLKMKETWRKRKASSNWEQIRKHLGRGKNK